MADWLRKQRLAARVTWRSSRSACRVMSRFRSTCDKCVCCMYNILTMHGSDSGLSVSITWKQKGRPEMGDTQKVAIVTGASRGIGRAVALRLAREGFAVVVNYAGNQAEAARVVSEVESIGGRAIAVQADVSKTADVARLFKETEKAFG